jgi:hypothetical protein
MFPLVPGTDADMGIGTSIILIAIGAILRFAVHGHLSAISIGTVGIILIIAGLGGADSAATRPVHRRASGTVLTLASPAV